MFLADITRACFETGIRLFSSGAWRTAAQATSEISFSLVTFVRLTFTLDVYSTLAASCVSAKSSLSVNVVLGDHTAFLSSASRSPLTNASIFNFSSTSSGTPVREIGQAFDFGSAILDPFVQLQVYGGL
uniref:Uncharacterized protein n=1 Tax=Glossina austeni TaxID=7395 RepID=A0A1A9VP55_GLOAU